MELTNNLRNVARNAKDAIESAVSWQDIVSILEKQVDLAIDGDPDAVKLVLAYKLGKPLTRMEHRGSMATPIKVIVEYVNESGSADHE